ncbi:radical SAM protein [Parabacteroides sp. W1-Q-101]|uniref:radical SAM/SPASM domain-containing protein n=1 Tax=Parabacteroides TaxID=375288 RepID=UPI00202E0EBE|nr:MULTISPECIES: radical SAM protein [Parabacteroides]MCM0716995.1 radical SAM protein [Parabacteroides sp. W1-Q-101]
MKTLRTSSYTIPVKLEKDKDKYMLIHGYTGAADVITANLFDKIKNISKTNNLSNNTLNLLLSRGYITTKTEEEEYAYVARIAKALHKGSDILNSYFTWVISYNCNFRCPYCFEERDKKDGKNKLSFSKKQVDIAYNIQEMIQPHKELRCNVITLYGGEPLLAENKEVVNYIVEEGCKRGYQFIAITNGYEINHFLNLLSPDKIKKLQITIDGPKEMHNQRRIHYKDNNTFDRIIENIKLALEKDIEIVVRMNTDLYNLGKFIELKDYFKENQFFNYPNFKIYSARLREYDYFTETERKGLKFIPLQKFTTKQINQGIDPLDNNKYYKIYNALKNKRSRPFNPIGCTAQSGGYVLDPIGNIYPCWEVIGKKEFVEGTYSSKGIIWNDNVLNRWHNSDIAQRKPCNHCKYALFCGGGCPYHYFIMNKRENQCSTFKELFNQTVNKAYAELY